MHLGILCSCICEVITCICVFHEAVNVNDYVHVFRVAANVNLFCACLYFMKLRM